jgi:hypothetical protein
MAPSAILASASATSCDTVLLRTRRDLDTLRIWGGMQIPQKPAQVEQFVAVSGDSDTPVVLPTSLSETRRGRIEPLGDPADVRIDRRRKL